MTDIQTSNIFTKATAFKYSMFRAGTLINTFVQNSEILKKHNITAEAIFKNSIHFIAGIIGNSIELTLDFHVAAGSEIIGKNNTHVISDNMIAIFLKDTPPAHAIIQFNSSVEKILAVIDFLMLDHLLLIEKEINNGTPLSEIQLITKHNINNILSLPIGLYFDAYYTKAALFITAYDPTGISTDYKINRLPKSPEFKMYLDALKAKLIKKGFLQHEDMQINTIAIKWEKLTKNLATQIMQECSEEKLFKRALTLPNILPADPEQKITATNHIIPSSKNMLTLIKDLLISIEIPEIIIHSNSEIDAIIKQYGYIFASNLVQKIAPQAMLLILKLASESIFYHIYLTFSKQIESLKNRVPKEILDNIETLLNNSSKSQIIKNAINTLTINSETDNVLIECLEINNNQNVDKSKKYLIDKVNNLLKLELLLPYNKIFKRIIDIKDEIDIANIQEVTTKLWDIEELRDLEVTPSIMSETNAGIETEIRDDEDEIELEENNKNRPTKTIN